MLISRRVLDKVGLLAEHFQPAYYEDVDYSLRVRAAGFKVMMAPRAICYHRVGTSLGREQKSPRTVFSANRNKAFTLRRNYSGWRRAAGLTYLAVTKPGRALLELAKGHPRTAWAVLSGMLVGAFSPSALRE
jgi:GT2 family glycosyltransferase